MSESVYLGDYGYTISIDCGMDLSDYSSLAILLSEPDSTNYISKSAVLSGTNNVICTIENGDITRCGDWVVQAFVVFSTGQYHSTTNTLTVIEPED